MEGGKDEGESVRADAHSLSHKEALEHEFVSSLDALDEFLRHNDQLQQHLKEVLKINRAALPRRGQNFKRDCQDVDRLLQAYLCLARARYGMGVHSVSSTKFDAHLEASTLISVSTDPPSFSLLPPGKGVLRRAAGNRATEEDAGSLPNDCSQDIAGVLCPMACTAIASHACMQTDKCSALQAT
jgi:hypothetical protein